MKKILILLCILCLAGCATLRKASGNLVSQDTLSATYPGDAAIMAEMAADEMARLYLPARIPIDLVRVDGAFGQTFDEVLRAKGFAVGPKREAVRIAYIINEIADEPGVGFVQVRASTGDVFSFRKVLR